MNIHKIIFLQCNIERTADVLRSVAADKCRCGMLILDPRHATRYGDYCADREEIKCICSNIFEEITTSLVLPLQV